MILPQDKIKSLKSRILENFITNKHFFTQIEINYDKLI